MECMLSNMKFKVGIFELWNQQMQIPSKALYSRQCSLIYIYHIINTNASKCMYADDIALVPQANTLEFRYSGNQTKSRS